MWATSNKWTIKYPILLLIQYYNIIFYCNLLYYIVEELLLRQGHIDPAYKALQRSLYHQHLTRWLDVFPREQVHVVDGEALIRHPFPELRRAEK